VQRVEIARAPRQRGTYVLLGLFLGGLGVHNFYAGQLVSGAIKLCLLVLTFMLDATTGFYSGFVLVAGIVNCLVALVEIVARTRDGQGYDFA